MRSIIIVDEAFAVRQTLNIFSNVILGFNECLTSSNGIEGIGYIFVFKPNIIIVDSTLPKFSGREVVDFLVTNEKLISDTTIKILLLAERKKGFLKDLPSNFYMVSKDHQCLSNIYKIIDSNTNLNIKKRILIMLGNSIISISCRIEKLREETSDNFKKFFFKFPFKTLLTIFNLSQLFLFLTIFKRGKEKNKEQSRKDLMLYRSYYYPTLWVIIMTFFTGLIQSIILILGGVSLNFLQHQYQISSIFASGTESLSYSFTKNDKDDFETFDERIVFTADGAHLAYASDLQEPEVLGIDETATVPEEETTPIEAIQEPPLIGDLESSTQEDTLEYEENTNTDTNELNTEQTLDTEEISNNEHEDNESEETPTDQIDDISNPQDTEELQQEGNVEEQGELYFEYAFSQPNYFVLTPAVLTLQPIENITSFGSINSQVSIINTDNNIQIDENVLTERGIEVSVTYQLSPNQGQDWYYYNTDEKRWSKTQQEAITSNTLEEITEALPLWNETIKTGTIQLRLFLQTNNGNYSPLVQELSVTVERSVISEVETALPEEPTLQETVIQQIDFAILQPEIFTASYVNGDKVVLGKLLYTDKTKKVSYEVTEQMLQDYEAVISYLGGREIGRATLRSNQRGEIEFFLRVQEEPGGFVVARIEKKSDPSIVSTTSKAVENSTFTVDSTGDEAAVAGVTTPGDLLEGVCYSTAGTCTLRTAITVANYVAGSDNIYFNIPTSDSGYRDYALSEIPSSGNGLGGDDYWTIRPASPLPTIQDTVIIDGATQEVNQGNRNVFGPDIEVKANFYFDASAVSSSINKMIVNTTLIGITVDAADMIITSNYLGIDAKGVVFAQPTDSVGIRIGGNLNTQVGQNTSNRNIIGGYRWGIRIETCNEIQTNKNYIRGNFIGIGPDGETPASNYGDGISIAAPNCRVEIGGESDLHRNIVSSNTGRAIIVSILGGDTNEQVEIYNNFFGTDVSGLLDRKNGSDGDIRFQSSTNIGTSNVHKIGALGKGNLFRFSPRHIWINTTQDVFLNMEIGYNTFANGSGNRAILIDGANENTVIRNNAIGAFSSDPYFGIQTNGNAGLGIQLRTGGNPVLQGNIVNDSSSWGIGIYNGNSNTRTSTSDDKIARPQIGGQELLPGSLCNGLEQNCITGNVWGGIFMQDNVALNEPTLWEDNEFSGGNGVDTTGDGIGDRNIEQSWFGLFELFSGTQRRTDLSGTTITLPENMHVRTGDDPATQVTTATASNVNCLGVSGVSCPAAGHTNGTLDTTSMLIPTGQTAAILSNVNNWFRITEYIYDGTGNKIEFDTFNIDENHAVSRLFSFDGDSTNNILNTASLRTIDTQDYTDRGEPWTDKPLATRDIVTSDFGRFQIAEVEIVDANPVRQEDGTFIITVDSTSDEDNVSLSGFDDGYGVYSGGGTNGANGLPDGKTSLREAIIVANNFNQPVKIHFNIPTTDAGWNLPDAPNAFSIYLNTILPNIIVSSVEIDGQSQEDFSGDTNTAISEPNEIPVIGNATTGPEIMITSPSNFNGGVFNLIGSNITINKLGFYSINTVLSGRARIIETKGGNSHTVSNSTFINNGGGIYVARVDTNTIVFKNNVVRGTTDWGRDVLELQFAVVENLLVENNQFVNNESGAIALSRVSESIIRNNLFKSNHSSLLENLSELYTFGQDVHDVVIENNFITGSPGTGLMVKGVNNSITFKQNIITNNSSIAIDLSNNDNLQVTLPDGFNVNDTGDTDTGPNDLMNYPIITEVRYIKNGDYLVKGTLDNSVIGEGPFDLEICESEINPLNLGECRRSLYFKENIIQQRQNGNNSWSVIISVPNEDKVNNDLTLSALVTNNNGSTSELSPNYNNVLISKETSEPITFIYNFENISPKDVVINDNSPTFNWNYESSTDADYFELWLAKEGEALDLISEIDSDVNSYKINEALENGIYQWRVIAYKDDGSTIGASEISIFTIQKEIETEGQNEGNDTSNLSNENEVPNQTNTNEIVIALVDLIDNINITETQPTFKWELDFSDQLIDNLSYKIYLSNNESTDFNDEDLIAILNSWSESEFTLEWKLECGSYKWKVVVIDLIENTEIVESNIGEFNILGCDDISIVDDQLPVINNNRVDLFQTEVIPFFMISSFLLVYLTSILKTGHFGFLFFFINYRKRKNWGIIYDSADYSPIPLAVIRVFKNNTQIAQSISDLDGIYGFNIDEFGELDINVNAYGYHSKKFKIRLSSDEIITDIALDSLQKNKTIFSFKFKNITLYLRFILLSVFFISGIYWYLIMRDNLNIYTLFMSFVYLILFLINILSILDLSFESKNKIIEAFTNNPLGGSILRIYDNKMKVICLGISNHLGKVKLRVKEGEYKVLIMKEGFNEFSGSVNVNKGGYITNNIKLTKLALNN